MTRRAIVLYSSANLNIIDGSAIRFVSLTETLSMTESIVHVVLPEHLTSESMATRLHRLPNVMLHAAVSATEKAPMTTAEAVTRLEDVVASVGASILLVVGNTMAQACGKSEFLAPILWSGLTSVNFPASAMSEAQVAQLREIAATSHRVLTQSEESRSFIESILPETAGKCLVLTPSVPDDYFVDLSSPPADSRELSLIHAGVTNAQSQIPRLTELPALLEERGCPARLTMMGTNYHPHDSEGLTTTDPAPNTPQEGVIWDDGDFPLERTIEKIAAQHVGIALGLSSCTTPLDISTSVLEYSAAGTPALVPRTPAHEALLGSDYPLFADADDIGTVLTSLLGVRDQLAQVRRSAQEAVRPYASSVVALHVETCFQHSEPNLRDFPLRDTRLKVVLAGHDFKFAGELIDLLEMRPDIELRYDRWIGLFKHDEKASEGLAEWADVIICEWAGQNAVWYSNHKRDDQRLVVRLHRYEVTGAWIDKIDMSRIDALITVSPQYHRLVRESKAWPGDRTHYIPNSLNALDLNRPKHPSAAHSLAIVGIVPFLKRPDRALDLLEALLTHDPDFVLHIKGRMPWEYPWAWRVPAEREAYLDFFARIGNTPGLSEHVVFSPFSPDMANWLRSIGWVLSPSLRESFHLAPAEGMASGALPLFWPRDGAEEIFGDEYLFPSIDDMADFILKAVNDEQDRLMRQQAVREQALAFDIKSVEELWMAHILPPTPGRR